MKKKNQSSKYNKKKPLDIFSKLSLVRMYILLFCMCGLFNFYSSLFSIFSHYYICCMLCGALFYLKCIITLFASDQLHLLLSSSSLCGFFELLGSIRSTAILFSNLAAAAVAATYKLQHYTNNVF